MAGSLRLIPSEVLRSAPAAPEFETQAVKTQQPDPPKPQTLHCIFTLCNLITPSQTVRDIMNNYRALYDSPKE